MARPNFENRQPPASNYMFIIGKSPNLISSIELETCVSEIHNMDGIMMNTIRIRSALRANLLIE